MSFISKFFSWIGGLFSEMKRLYNKLASFEKEASIKASGIIALINANLTATPDVIFSIIQLKFPTVTKEYLQNKLGLAIKVLGIGDKVADRTLEENIKLLQAYLSKYEGNGWVATTLGAVNALLTALLPETTPLQKVSVLLEYIYQKIVKEKIV